MADVLWLLFAALLIVGGVFALGQARAAGKPAPPMPAPPTFDEHARTAVDVARPALRIDTANGSHDELPIREDVRQILRDYVDGMWHHTQEMP